MTLEAERRVGGAGFPSNCSMSDHGNHLHETVSTGLTLGSVSQATQGNTHRKLTVLSSRTITPLLLPKIMHVVILYMCIMWECKRNAGNLLEAHYSSHLLPVPVQTAPCMFPLFHCKAEARLPKHHSWEASHSTACLLAQCS